MVSSVETRSRKKRVSCVHHWLVSSPNGETSWGECRKCGRRKRFLNRFDGNERPNNSDLFVEAIGWRRGQPPAAQTSDANLEAALGSLRSR